MVNGTLSHNHGTVPRGVFFSAEHRRFAVPGMEEARLRPVCGWVGGERFHGDLVSIIERGGVGTCPCLMLGWGVCMT